MSASSLPLRPGIVGEQPYGAPQLDVAYRLNVNENPYPPSEAIRRDMAEAIYQAATSLNRYADREAIALRESLARYLGSGLSADNIWVANGSNEIMTHLLSAFGGPGRTVLTFGPTYAMYPEYARNTLTDYVCVDRKSDYSIDARAALAAIDNVGADIVIVTTPNNPTGTVTPLSVIEAILDGTDAIVIIDEAYQEFSAEPSAIALVDRYERLVVSRTMSKAFALAGGRVGYLAAHASVVDACRIVRLPYHLSIQTQTIARVALDHAAEMLQNVAALRDACQELQRWLSEQGWDVIDSQANFCLFGPVADRHALWQHLLDQGVLIRETGPAGYLRVSAGTPEEMAAFKAALLTWKDAHATSND